MIYTSYYSKMKDFPENFIPISISQGVPKWYKGLICKELAPSWDILMEYKNSTDTKEERENRYNERYKKEILNKITPLKIMGIIASKLPEELKGVPLYSRDDIHIVLLCYEKTEDFCHRKLVSEWLNEHNIPCKELTNKILQKENINEMELE